MSKFETPKEIKEKIKKKNPEELEEELEKLRKEQNPEKYKNPEIRKEKRVWRD